MSKVTNKKKLMKILLSVLIVFLIINIIWGLYVYFKYNPFQKSVEEHTKTVGHSYVCDGYTYSVKKPSYLSLTGNLAITPVLNLTTEGLRVGNDGITPFTGESIDVIIWPKLFGGYEIVVNISKYSGKINSNNENEYTILEFYVDENMNPIENLSSEKKKVYEANKNNLKDALKKINSVWNLNE
ncbi:MAG: hypothetical protein RR012_03110 [Oscillospiraceae bacterium]